MARAGSCGFSFAPSLWPFLRGGEGRRHTEQSALANPPFEFPYLLLVSTFPCQQLPLL